LEVHDFGTADHRGLPVARFIKLTPSLARAGAN
jgi:hypothetical protein